VKLFDVMMIRCEIIISDGIVVCFGSVVEFGGCDLELTRFLTLIYCFDVDAETEAEAGTFHCKSKC